jgi:hypothetical protein
MSSMYWKADEYGGGEWEAVELEIWSLFKEAEVRQAKRKPGLPLFLSDHVSNTNRKQHYKTNVHVNKT